MFDDGLIIILADLLLLSSRLLRLLAHRLRYYELPGLHDNVLLGLLCLRLGSRLLLARLLLRRGYGPGRCNGRIGLFGIGRRCDIGDYFRLEFAIAPPDAIAYIGHSPTTSAIDASNATGFASSFFIFAPFPQRTLCVAPGFLTYIYTQEPGFG